MSAAHGWALLVLSGVLDVIWALATKKSEGMTHWGWGGALDRATGRLCLYLEQSARNLAIGNGLCRTDRDWCGRISGRRRNGIR